VARDILPHVSGGDVHSLLCIGGNSCTAWKTAKNDIQ